MNSSKYLNVMRKYKKCPNCGTTYRDYKLKHELKDEIIHIFCECGFSKYVDENNKEVNKI